VELIMATKYMRNSREVTTDFYHGTGENEVLVPFGNLALWDDATLAQYGVTKVVTADVPQVISDRQFFQLLATMGIITTQEALDAVGPGIIPAAMEAFLVQLPEADQFAARMILTGATQFERTHPLVPVFATLFGWSSQDLDAFWTEAYAL
jgi:hypothetical protein